MRSISAADLMSRDDTGDVLLLFSETGEGKTVTSLKTCRLPVEIIYTEPRDIKKSLIAAKRPELYEPGMCNVVYYDTFTPAMEYVATHDFKGINTVILDSITQTMILLLQEITSDAYQERVNDPKKRADAIAKALTNEVKSSVEDYGALSGQMKRLTGAIAKLSQNGRTVILLARLQENPRYDRSVMAGPALTGKDFSKDFAGWCDFIGILTTNKDKDGKTVYPPLVSFDKGSSYLAKWTGIMPELGVKNKPLDIQKILAVAHGEGGK